MRKLLKNIIKFGAIIFSIIVVIIISITPIKSYSQNGFEIIFEGPEYEAGSGVQQTSDSGFIICGYTEGYVYGSKNGYIIKTDIQGNLVWSTIIESEENVELWKIKELGNYYYSCGNTRNIDLRTACYFAKLDNNGDTIYTKTYLIGIESLFTDFIITDDSAFILCAYSDHNICYLKIDQMGNLLWSKIINAGSMTVSLSIVEGLNNDYLICGSIAIIGYNVFLIKIDNTGDTVWLRTYDELFEEAVGYKIITTYDSCYMICGSCYEGYHKMFLLKLNQNGDTVWLRTYSGPLVNTIGRSVVQTQDSGYIISGYTSTTAANSTDIYVVKTDKLGNTIWTETYGGQTDDATIGSDITFDNAAIIIGRKGIFPSGSDVYLIKTTPEIVADFSALPTNGDSPLQVQFTDISFGNLTSWEWDFQNDGVIDSYLRSPSYIYTESGLYDVYLKVSNGSSEDIIVRYDYINVTEPIYYIIQTFSSPEVGGNTNGSGNFPLNTSITVSAEPNLEYFFVKWTENGSSVSLDQDYTFTVTKDLDLTAYFSLKEVLNVSIENTGPEEICQGDTVHLTAIASGGDPPYEYIWTSIPEGIIGNQAELQDLPQIPTTYIVAIADANLDEKTDSVFINVLESPPANIVGKGEPPYMLICVDSGYSYQWYYNDNLLNGEAKQFYYPGEQGLEVGTYYAVVTNDLGCDTRSNEFVSDKQMDFMIYPNPNEGSFNVIFKLIDPVNSAELIIMDMTGKVIEEVRLGGAIGNYRLSIKQKGVFIAELRTEGQRIIKKLIIY